MAGGSGTDSFTGSVAHRTADGKLVLDVLYERRPPFSPEATVTEWCAVLKYYGITRVGGDKFAGDWPAEQHRKHGVTYVPSERTKSEIYLAFLPLLNSNRVELLDHPRLVAQLAGLERRTARGGKDSIDHAPGKHDGLANSACGALVLAADAARSKPIDAAELGAVAHSLGELNQASVWRGPSDLSKNPRSANENGLQQTL